MLEGDTPGALALLDVPATEVAEVASAPKTRKKERVLLPESDASAAYAPSRSVPAPAQATRKRGPLEIDAMYCDGGLLGPNVTGGNPDGGTWAWCFVNSSGERIAEVIESTMDQHEIEERGLAGRKFEGAGVILPWHVAPFTGVSNNVTELVAMLLGMKALPVGWSGTIYTDSWVTLCRVGGYRRGDAVQRSKLLETVPERLADEISCQRARLGKIEFILLDGHPTQEQLAAGKGKRGNPVSIHNKWCDDACNLEKDKFWKKRTPAAASCASELPNGVEESPEEARESESEADSLPESPAEPVAASGGVLAATGGSVRGEIGPEVFTAATGTVSPHVPTIAALTRRSQRRAAGSSPADSDSTIQAAFEAFHAEHPEVYGEVVRLAFILREQHQRGRVKWVAIGAIWERMRSNWLFEGGDTSGYKLNNNYRSRYARMLIADFPEFGALIETRELQSK